MIDLIEAATAGAIAGSAIMRRIDLRKIVDLQRSRDHYQSWADRRTNEKLDASASSARLADACLAKQARIDRALEQVTPGSNATVTRMARILRGEQG